MNVKKTTTSSMNLIASDKNSEIKNHMLGRCVMC